MVRDELFAIRRWCADVPESFEDLQTTLTEFVGESQKVILKTNATKTKVMINSDDARQILPYTDILIGKCGELHLQGAENKFE